MITRRIIYCTKRTQSPINWRSNDEIQKLFSSGTHGRFHIRPPFMLSLHDTQIYYDPRQFLICNRVELNGPIYIALYTG